MFSETTSTRSGLVFNFAGRIVIALSGILFVPVYIRYLGIEVYGVIGFFVGLQTFLSLLDLGISPTLTREVARLSAFPDKQQEIRDLSRTLEFVVWGAAGVMMACALILSPLVAHYWLQPETITPATVLQALMLMSITFGLQWCINFYSGGLLGLQRQKLYNIVNSGGVLLRSAGAIAVLAYVSPTVQAFLIWQAAITLLLLLAIAGSYWKCLPAGPRPTFRKELLRGVWTYAAGMTGISLVALILTQTDKVILSRLISLENFGYYTLAYTLAATAIGIITGSISTSFFPRFSQLVAREDDAGLRSIYHFSSQVMSVLLIPAFIITAVFSFEILMLWTRDAKIAENTWLLLTLVSIGTGIHGLMHLPYYMQLANGLTKLAFWQNVAAIILLVPFMVFAAIRYGAAGGAMTWVILNVLNITVSMQVMHRLLLKGELKKWVLEDVGPPLVVAGLVTAGFKLIFGSLNTPLIIFIALSAVTAVVFFSTAMAAGQIRKMVFARLGTLFGRV